MKVFLSYRRADVGGYAGRLHDGLAGRLGRQSVFHDVSTIRPGEDFTMALDRALDECDVMLVVIGPGWLTAAAADGRRRLDDPADYVRLEVGRGLARADVPVVPVLVGGGRLPRGPELPDDLRGLARRQAVTLRDDAWTRDLDALIVGLRHPDGARRSPARRWVLAVGAAAIPAVLASGWWLSGRDGDGTIPRCDGDLAGWTELPVDDSPVGASVAREQGQLLLTTRAAWWRRSDEGWEVLVDVAARNETPDGVYHGEWVYDALVVAQRSFPKHCYSAEPEEVLPETVGDARVGFTVRCPPEGRLELVLEDGSRLDVTDPDLSPTAC